MSLAVALVVTAVAVVVSGAFAAGGRLQLNLVNSGTQSSVYNESMTADGNCDQYLKATSLSTNKGTGLQSDSPGYAFESDGCIAVLVHGARRARVSRSSRTQRGDPEAVDVVGRRDVPWPDRRPDDRLARGL